MLKHVESKIFVLPFLFVIACVFLTGCQSSKKTAEETDEKLLLNEHVTLENFERIRIGDPKTGEGGMTYEEVLSLMGDISPQFESEIKNGDGSSELEANWWRYTRPHQYGTDLIGVKFINGKAYSKFQEGLEK
ncbi:hypothetical protein NSQ82_10575 [Caldifermentibacillus hisashii]|uniref:hypothetical protein n=1 Tax=Caldifermentibacillus hisashii TaxID=996558 RepID=UPI0031B71312